MSKQTDLINIPDAITVSGSNVGIGTSSPTAYTGYSTIALNGTTGGALEFKKGDTQMARITNAGDLVLQFATNNTERLRIDSDGLKFNGDTAAANALNDYEYGGWTPTLPNGGTIDTNIKSTYTKIGIFVTAYCYIAFTATNNSSTFNIGGLPFTQTVTAAHGGGSISYTASQNVQHFSAPLVTSSSNRIYFHRHDGNTSTIKNSEFGGNQRVFIIQVNYTIN